MLEAYARGSSDEKTVLFEQEVKAFTAEDALTQHRASEGGSLGQPPFVFAIEPLPDVPPESGSRDPWLSFPVTDEEAKCACGAVAVQWRKDTPVCGNPECLTRATFGGK
jgi:hypothetical protein